MNLRIDTKKLFNLILKGEYHILYSSITQNEIHRVPKQVVTLIEEIPETIKTFVKLTEKATALGDSYISENVVGTTSRNDCLHIALATIHKADILVSWNFKHIVNVHRIRGYNAVNLKFGYPTIDIRSPKEIISYEK